MLIASKPTIIIIDDDLSILKTFTRIFQRRGYDVTIAQKGSEAIEKINASQFDVALIDFCLPDMEGIELFPHIQRASPGAIKIMLTGKAQLMGSISGADAFLGKPIAPEKLLSLIDCKLKDRDIDTE